MAVLECFSLQYRDAPTIVPENETILIFINVGSNFSNNLLLSQRVDNIDKAMLSYVEGFIYRNNRTITEWIYPNSIPSIELNTIMRAVPIPDPSPLGIRIHETYGSWWAFRAIVRVAGHFDAGKTLSLGPSACLSCHDKPCISSCPSSALKRDGYPNMHRCFNYRSQEKSPCASTCLARLSCPFGHHFRYSDRLIQYLYNHSLAGIEKWLDSNKNN